LPDIGAPETPVRWARIARVRTRIGHKSDDKRTSGSGRSFYRPLHPMGCSLRELNTPPRHRVVLSTPHRAEAALSEPTNAAIKQSVDNVAIGMATPSTLTPLGKEYKPQTAGGACYMMAE